MPIFSQLKYNNYVPQYVGAPLDEFLASSSAVQGRYNQVQEGYSLIGELADTLQTSPLEGDKSMKSQLLNQVNASIEDAAKRGNFDQIQNEMRFLAKQYAKQAAPIKENLSRYQAAEKAISESKLPKTHQQYLLQSLRSKPGLSYDEVGNPSYLQPDTFAENVDLREVYEKYINDYKSDKYPGGIRAVTDPQTGLVEYYSNTTNELVDANEVQAGLQRVALFDPKVQDFIIQDAAANGVQITNGQQFLDYATPLMQAYTDKAAFSKVDTDFRLGHADEARKDDMGGGFTFPINWGVPAREGTTTPSDLRKSLKGLDESRSVKNDEFGRFIKERQIDPLTGKSVDGVDYSEDVALYNQQLDAIDAQKWELQEVEANAKKDAGLPANWVPSEKAIKEAEIAYQEAANPIGRTGSEFPYTPEERAKMGQEAYEKSLDNSNDPSLKAYRTALKKNAQDRTDVRGITTFGKNTRAEMDIIGDRLISGESGAIRGKDLATGREIENLSEYGTAVQNLGYGIENGQLQLVYKTGERNPKNGDFIPSQHKISVNAPPELVSKLVEKKIIDPADLDISKQIGQFGGRVQVGNLQADVEIKRSAETGSADVVVVLNNGKKRVAFPSQGAAIKFINNLAKTVNGN